MSANLTSPREAGYVDAGLRQLTERLTAICPEVGLVGRRRDRHLPGIAGFLVIATIVGLTICLALKYLF